MVNKQYQEGVYNVIYVDEKIQKRASDIFDKKAVSKKNTIFDAIVVATAEQLGTKLIFSFDGWYPKLGFKLVS
jgi:predicted nucleic acid-binding protein